MVLVPLLSACTGNGDNPKDTDPSITSPDASGESTVPPPEIPAELKGSGEEFKIFTQGWYNYSPLNVIDIGVTEYTEDMISHGAFLRDQKIAEELGVVVTAVSQPECYDSFVALKTQSLVGCEYDLLLLRSAVYTQAIVSDMCYDLSSADLTYLDVSKPWWDEGSYEALSICDQYYGLCGDFTVSDDMTLWTLYFNKGMRASLELDDPYELVKNQEWTYERLWEMASMAASNSDGNSGMTYEDTWGVTYLRDTVSGMFNSVGINVAEKDDEGMPYLSFYNDANVTKVLDIFDNLYNDEVCFNIHANPGSDEVKVFTDGRALFTFGGIYYAPDMRNTTVDFGMLPYPKYDTAQGNYISSGSPLFLTVLCIPRTNTQNLDLRSCFMENYAYFGSRYIVGEFYDDLLMGKIAKDVETAEILDFIFGNVTYDIGSLFNFGDIAFQLIDMSITGNKNIAGVYGEFEKKAQTEIDELILKLI